MVGCGRTTKRVQFPSHINLSHFNNTGSKRTVSTYEDDEITKNLTVRRSVAKHIVGRGGEQVRRIEAESGATVDVSRVEEGEEEGEGDDNRVISITGGEEQIRLAYRLIEVIMLRQSDVSDEDSTKVTIPNEMTRSLIGRGGEKIKELQRLSGTYINVTRPQPGDEQSEGTIVNIAGKPEQMKLAEKLIQEHIDEMKNVVAKDTVDTDGEVETISMTVRNSMASFLLGGGRIGGIRRNCGARIKVSKVHDISNRNEQRLITITGSSDEVQRGQQLIQELMNEATSQQNRQR